MMRSMFAVVLTVCCAVSGFAGGMKMVDADKLRPENASQWQLVPGAVWGDPGVLTVEVPANPSTIHHKATMPIDFSELRGRLLLFTVQVKAEDVSKPPHKWNGIKFMIDYDSPSIGKNYHHPVDQFGSFDWKELTFCATIPEDTRNGTLSLGLEDCYGRVSFRDLKIYAFDKPDDLGVKAQYTPLVTGQSTLRGTMSPDKFNEGDLEVLSSWGANVIRWQFVRGWGLQGTDRNVAEYDKWINAKLDELDKVLQSAQKNNLKVVVDLHSPPGGRRSRAENSDMEMFYNRVYADQFVDIWKRIAARFKDHPAIWAYDLVNEPMQSYPSEFGYWELQLEAAKAIRAIDPERPIIVEANNWANPDAFAYLSPLPLTNIIYQVHVYNPGAYTNQQVDTDWKKAKDIKLIAYPGMISGTMYDKETLRKILQPVRDFQLKYNARIYVGEFSAVRWAPGAEQYLADCIALFEEYGWDWTYHAFREWQGWSVELSDDPYVVTPVSGTKRKEVLLNGFKKNMK